MSGKWDFSSCFLQAGCSAHRQGRRAPLGVVWWGLGPDASPGSGGWVGGLTRARCVRPTSAVTAPECRALSVQGSVHRLAGAPGRPGGRVPFSPPRTDEEAETPAAEVTCPRSLSH